MNDIIFEALKLLIMVCVAVIARYVIPWLKSRIEQDKMAAIEKMVTQAVLYAQQVLTSSLDGFIPTICLISFDVIISFRVNLSAMSAMLLIGTSLNGSRKNLIVCF